MLVITMLLKPWIGRAAYALSRRPLISMLVLALLPVLLRVLLLPLYPAPAPVVADDFSYLLSGDTFRHLRLTNPPHPFSQFFETLFVLQRPTYSSIFPPGQGLAIALGWTLFGHPWAGVLIPIAAFCALVYWMLSGWIEPVWALAGGLLAVFEFGPLNQWTNSYWGGGVSAVAGCLVFGSIPRLLNRNRRSDLALLGIGLALQLMVRPFEAIFLFLSAALFLRPVWRTASKGLIFVLPAIALLLLYNRAVTKSWITLPYMLSRYQYGVPAAFTFEPNPQPHNRLTPEQEADYEIQSSVHGPGTDRVGTYLGRLFSRIRFLRFFMYPPLYLALPFFVPALRERRYQIVLLTIVLFALGTNFYPYFYSHYIAAITCLLLLVNMVAIERLSAISPAAAMLVLSLCTAQFTFWYGLHIFGGQSFAQAMIRYETWDAISHPGDSRRAPIEKKLSTIPGKHLVFVSYSSDHSLNNEWVFNGASVDVQRIVWARDLGPEENKKLLSYYPTRKGWRVDADSSTPALHPYLTGLVLEDVP